MVTGKTSCGSNEKARDIHGHNACIWKQVVQPEQGKMALDSSYPAYCKGEIYLGEPVDRNEALWEFVL